MSTLEPSPSPQARPAPDTFCFYLAQQLILNRGFSLDAMPVADPIAAQSDIVLSLIDGMSLTIIGLIDREAHPGRAFSLTPAELNAIGNECLKNSGQGRSQMRLTIQLMEVGPGSADQPHRLGAIKRESPFSKILLSAWVIDTGTASLWTTAHSAGRGTQDFIQQLLTVPHEEVVATPVSVIAQKSFPWLTAAILLLLAAVFAAEIKFNIGDWGNTSPSKLATLAAFGGLERNLVLNSGEWYRIFSAPFLHADASHLAWNAIFLAWTGYVLEGAIGRAWFAAVFVVGAICGSLLSLTHNPVGMVCVGASGAVLGLLTAMLTVSFHFAPGATRKRLQKCAILLLVPSLLPLTSTLKGITVDYAAHFGGAIGGIVIALVALALWPRTEIRPRFQTLALLVALTGGAGIAYAAVPIHANYPTYEFRAALPLPTQILTTLATARTRPAEVVGQYPRDPRLRLMYASTLMSQPRDLAGAERELRAALVEEAIWRPLMPAELGAVIRTSLASVLVEMRRMDEAKNIARPVCDTLTKGPFRATLDQQKLCSH